MKFLAQYCRAVQSFCPPHWCSLTVDDETWVENELHVVFSITVSANEREREREKFLHAAGAAGGASDGG